VPDVPQFVLDRLRAKEPIFTADEVACWSDGLLDQLLAEGIVQPAENVRSVACDACGHDHVEEVNFVESPPGSGLRAYITCPDAGRVAVPLGRLQSWIVNAATPDTSGENDQWFADDPPPGGKFTFGPLEGTVKAIAEWMGMDQRTIKRLNGRTSWWVKKVHGKKFIVWFSTQAKYATANEKRLAAASQNRMK